jgi:hypothetical protein
MKTLREMLMLGVMIALLPVAAHAQEIKVTLLGTGTPVPAMNRFGPSILIEAGGQEFLFDAGRGAMQRLSGRSAVDFHRKRDATMAVALWVFTPTVQPPTA